MNLPTCIDQGILAIAGRDVLAGLPPEYHLIEDATGCGAFLSVRPWILRHDQGVDGPHSTPYTGSHLAWALGTPVGMTRFLACARSEAYWMRPNVGSACADIPGETQCLLWRRADGFHVLAVPLIDDPMRFTLRGGRDGLTLVGDTGDALTPGSGGVCLFIACGSDPYVLHAQAAAAVAARLPGCRLRRDKPLPDHIDLFGWCTWDAFYEKVDPDRIRSGLAAFAAIGVPPPLLIIDDGWLSVVQAPTGGRQLSALAPNRKFGNDFTATTTMARREFGVRRILAWHAIHGSWAGVSARHLPQYAIREVARSFPPGLLARQPASNHPFWGALVALPDGDGITTFFDDWHRLLAAQGIDGVKVDVQASLESCATGAGGRVGLIRRYRAALEASVARHFAGRLLNCMGHNSESWYCSPGSNLARFSQDFYPQHPETHGPHLWINAALGLWFGEFQQPDWDMFHSLHPQATFHAAARAISGGPVYVSDKPGQHDPALLRRLVLADGTVPRCPGPARLGASSLYADPLHEAVPLTVVNHNRHGAVIGVFNLHAEGPAITACLAPDELPGLAGEHLLHRGSDGALLHDGASCTLAPLGHDVITLAPIVDGLAVIGLAHLLNPGGAISRVSACTDGVEIELRDGGTLLAWAAGRPNAVSTPTGPLPWTWDPTDGRLAITVPAAGVIRIQRSVRGPVEALLR